ncbi:MAG: hypothetical protein QXN15_09630 [Candidatus Jordarchaeales archaeon]|nr:hypothetical protein [Candidatus Jordarchaeia archaeon]
MSFPKKKVYAVIREYNKYHAPEAIAKLVQVGGNWFIVLFSGSFCFSCGVYDYIDDLRVLLEDFGLNVHIDHSEKSDEGILVLFIMKNEAGLPAASK